MKCTKCGAEQEADVKFCIQCGAPMEQDNQTPEDNGPDPAKEEPAAEARGCKSGRTGSRSGNRKRGRAGSNSCDRAGRAPAK